MISLRAISAASFTACAVGLFVHSLGVYALLMCRKRNNQVTILFVLSISEMCFLVCEIIANAMLLQCHDQQIFFNSSNIADFKDTIYPDVYKKVEAVLNHLVICMVNSMLITLTMDRLLCVLCPLKYKLARHKHVLNKVLVLTGVTSLLLGLLALSEDTISTSIVTNFVLASASLITFAITYTIIAVKIKRSNKISNCNRGAMSIKKKRKVFRNQYLVPFLVTATYITMYFVPVCLVFYMKQRELSQHVYNVYRGLWFVVDVGAISDPVIYILIVKSYREVLLQRFCRPRIKVRRFFVKSKE